MKEQEYRSVPGTETFNSPEQLDTFELKQARGLKDRYVFDFSNARIRGFFPGGSNPSSKSAYVIGNMSAWGKNTWDFEQDLTQPGDGALYRKNMKFAPGVTPQYPDIPVVTTVTNDDIEIINRGDSYGNIAHGGAIYSSGDLAFAVGKKYTGGASYGWGNTADNIDDFRSGYVEFTIKTSKQNSIIAWGKTDELGYLGYDTSQTANPSNLNSDVISLPEGYSRLVKSTVNIKNGKVQLTYEDKYGNNKISFDVTGNTNIADDQWHHVVINIGKPGVTRTHAKKFNKKFIEIWVDGKLDKRDSEVLDKSQVFFPVYAWLWADPELSFQYKGEGWKTPDSSISFTGGFLGLSEFESFFNYPLEGNFLPEGDSVMFVGSMHHWVAGVNNVLTQYEIGQRNRLYRGYEKNEADLMTASAEIVQPTVSSNAKKALKLFWNNLVNEGAKDGVELDADYNVFSYSVTHKCVNSPTEIFNIDLANDKKIKYLSDVRVVISEQNVIYWKPAGVAMQNYDELLYSTIGAKYQKDMYDMSALSTAVLVYNSAEESGTGQWKIANLPSEIVPGSVIDITFSGVVLQNGDRILITNQYNSKNNGIYVYNGPSNLLQRAGDADSADKVTNAVVRVTDGYHKNTSWFMSDDIDSMVYGQNWIELESHPSSETIMSQPLFTSRWSDIYGNEGFINLQDDLSISDFDLIVFMNYPETNEQIRSHFVGYDDFEIKTKYNEFIHNLKTVVANGASLMVNSPKLAEDLGIVRTFTKIDQEIEVGDGRSSLVNPFQFDEPAERYFDTHRQNAYHVDTLVPGLTNKETWLLTEFINYIPKDQYDYEQWHAKYSYRQFGLQEGNEFLIPSLALRQVAGKDDLPGARDNSKAISKLNVVAPNNVLAGTIVTSLANTHYHGATIANNEYDDYATTIIVHNGQQLGGTPINGKIFVNCVEDAYTMSREEYNKAIVQVIPVNDPFETNSSRQWQYSTSRLNRLPKRVNVKELTSYGQTTATNGGGGPLIQAATNSSNGMIRSETDKGNVDYQSDLYTQEVEEVYLIQEVPVLSMTWLGLKWLAGE